MVDEIMKRLYRIVVPLPNSPLKDLNSYVIKGEDRNLIIDTGFNRSVCYEAMQKGVAELGIDLEQDRFYADPHARRSYGACVAAGIGNQQDIFQPD